MAVVSPKAYNKFGTGAGQVTSITATDEIFKELCYFYIYDGLGRVVEKHVPGAGWRYSVYNKNDIETFFADDADKAKGYWQWRKVDALSREIQNGILNGIGSTSRATLQTAFDSFTGQNYETTGTSLLGYTNVSFPSTYVIADANVMETRYYDDYAWQTDATYNFQSSNAFHTQGLTKGMMTGTIKRNIETNTWQKMVLYYDYQGKLIQDFHLTNRGNLVRKDHQHRFNGELLKTVIEKKNGSTVLSKKTFSYDFDHLGRKAKFKHALGANEKTIAKYEYDQIGRLSQKLLIPLYKKLTIGGGNWTNPQIWDVGGVPNQNDDVSIEVGHTVTIAQGTIANAANLSLKNGAKLLNYGKLNLGGLNGKIPSIAEPGYIKSIQTLNYKYHIRGGLRGLNLDASNNLTDNLFSYRLDYEDDGTLFDGNIRTQYWKSNIDGKQRAFSYTYDGASRLTSAPYASTQAGEDYALNSVNYDANGNITNLSRNGATNASYSSFGNVDNLTYTYQSSSNKLAKIDDATTSNTDLGDFRDGTNTDDDYEYWLDGSLKKDKNKKIASITYNYLKLPKTITFDNGKTITTEYDAGGVKLKKIDSNGETTDYEEDEIYVNGVLYQTSHDEGRIVDGIYEYNITDHLGNLRVAFRDKSGVPEITQSIFYDPWGLSMKGMQFAGNPANFNNFQFLNRETQIETGLVDLINRQYDPQRGQFTSIDPLAELSKRFSPMVYGNNNPLLMIDPDGLRSIWNGKYGSESGYTDSETGESRSWGQVQGEYGFENPSTHTDEQGNVIAVYNDGNNGVYQHKNSDLQGMGFDPNRMSLSTTKAEKKGTTKFWDEFLNPTSGQAQGRILFEESWSSIVTKLHNLAMEMDLREIGDNSKLHKPFDLKNNKENAPFGVMTGKLLDGEYATARSAGNYLAGYNGRTGTYFGVHISFETYMKLAGALQVGKYNKTNAAGIVMWGTAYGPAPWYGEIPYTGRMVKQGWMNGK